MVALLENPSAPRPSAFAASEIVPLPEFTFALIAIASRELRVTVPLMLPIAWLTASVPAPTVRTSSAPPDVVMPFVLPLPDPLSEVIEPMVRLLASKYVSGLAPDRLAAIVVISFVVLAREKVPPPRRRRP